MVGRAVSLRGDRIARVAESDAAPAAATPDAPEVLRLNEVTVRTRDGRILLDRLSLHVRAGEIVGVAGVEGNGQRPLADVLSSLTGVLEGDVLVAGEPVPTGKAGAMAAAGVGVIPEDRHDSGVVMEMTIAENLWLVNPGDVARAGVINERRMHDTARRLIDEFEISCSGPDAPLYSLSGGNQQRVVLARELSHGPKVLIAAQPTRGLDVGAIEYMSERLRRAAADGVGVLLISSELEEILDLADRILVISDGQIIGEMDRRDADLGRLGLMMGGQAA
jgi:simple sugar transport system ATP-binding protein